MRNILNITQTTNMQEEEALGEWLAVGEEEGKVQDQLGPPSGHAQSSPSFRTHYAAIDIWATQDKLLPCLEWSGDCEKLSLDWYRRWSFPGRSAGQSGRNF